jgi:hypothetical protein
VRVADFCRENLLDYYKMVEALKQEKFEAESFDAQVQCGDLVMQTDAQETRIQEKDSEVLRLLNQIATDMIRKSDVDRLIEEAVAKATAALKADFPIILHFYTSTDTQQVMKREPIFPQHFHNNFICWEARGNKAPEMAFKTL